jgi:Ni/Co efflux regulator RcnB
MGIDPNEPGARQRILNRLLIVERRKKDMEAGLGEPGSPTADLREKKSRKKVVWDSPVDKEEKNERNGKVQNEGTGPEKQPLEKGQLLSRQYRAKAETDRRAREYAAQQEATREWNLQADADQAERDLPKS